MDGCSLGETEKTSSGYGLAIDSSEKNDVNGSICPFSELGLAAMLEASDHDSTDQVSPCLGSSFDTFC